MKQRVVCVSNRVQISDSAAKAGGLAVGICDVLRRQGGLWFGWSGELTDADDCGTPVLATRKGIQYATVPLSNEQFARYYHGFANDVLWPVFHYMPDKMRFQPAHWREYGQVNARFARCLAPLVQADDLIWVHDYHLIPLAMELRRLGVSNRIGIFLHTPFPHVEVLRVMPIWRELTNALCEYDLVGFQTEGDHSAFRSCVASAFSKEVTFGPAGSVQLSHRTLNAGVFPIGIDVDAVQAAAARAADSNDVASMISSLHGRQLIIGVDRLDYSKGLIERFAAYERLLDAGAEHRSRITYLQIAPLSRKEMASYNEIRRSLEQAAGRINGRFGGPDWTPIRYMNRNVPRDDLMGLMRAAHVGLVTPLRDGMNLVAKEYIAAQDSDDPGVLVLSEFAGAARELESALIVNPYDAHQVAAVIGRALAMPLAERRERQRTALEVLRKADIGVWARRFTDTLAERESRADLPFLSISR